MSEQASYRATAQAVRNDARAKLREMRQERLSRKQAMSGIAPALSIISSQEDEPFVEPDEALVAADISDDLSDDPPQDIMSEDGVMGPMDAELPLSDPNPLANDEASAPTSLFGAEEQSEPIAEAAFDADADALPDAAETLALAELDSIVVDEPHEMAEGAPSEEALPEEPRLPEAVLEEGIGAATTDEQPQLIQDAPIAEALPGESLIPEVVPEQGIGAAPTAEQPEVLYDAPISEALSEETPDPQSVSVEGADLPEDREPLMPDAVSDETAHTADLSLEQAVEPGAVLETAPDADPIAVPASMRDILPGAGPGLIWMLSQCNIHDLADLAAADPTKLSQDLGLVGQILDVGGWIELAKANQPIDDRITID